MQREIIERDSVSRLNWQHGNPGLSQCRSKVASRQRHIARQALAQGPFDRNFPDRCCAGYNVIGGIIRQFQRCPRKAIATRQQPQQNVRIEQQSQSLSAPNSRPISGFSASISSGTVMWPLSRPQRIFGLASIGTSRAAGVPLIAITTSRSAPERTAATKRDRRDFASCIFTTVIAEDLAKLS